MVVSRGNSHVSGGSVPAADVLGACPYFKSSGVSFSVCGTDVGDGGVVPSKCSFRATIRGQYPVLIFLARSPHCALVSDGGVDSISHLG